MVRRRLVVLSLFLALGCESTPPMSDAGSDAPVIVDPHPEGCEHIDPTLCLLPWPSSRYLVDDPSTATGRRVEIPAEAMPADTRGRRASPAPYSGRDGFSPLTSMMISFPGALDDSLLADEEHIADTLLPGSRTVIVDMETGERVAHFAEIDRWEATDPLRAPLYLRPAQRLRANTRYAVGIRNLRLVDGSPVAPSEYFRALRDDTDLEGTDLEGTDVDTRRPEFDEVFTALGAAGAPRAELIAAWSFATGSDEAITRDLVAMRDAALAALGEAGLGCTVTEVRDADEGGTLPEGIWRRIEGTFTMPSFLGGAAPDDVEQARLHRDGSGRPTLNGTVEAPFTVLIPTSVRDRVAGGGAPGQMVVYGHGILGERSEIDSRWMTDSASELGWVVIATDWWGMSRPDAGRLLSTLSGSFDDFESTPERLHQGVLNAMGLMRSFSGSCAALSELAVPLDDGSTAAPYDAAHPMFYGNSLGGILGGTFAGLATDTDRFALGVAGGNWTLLITRSDAWRSFDPLIAASFPDALTRDLLILMTASLWDPIDAANYAPHWLADPLPGTPIKHVMVQIGIGDVAVSNATSLYVARSAGLPLMTPSVIDPYGLATIAGPADSALTVYALPGIDPIAPGPHDPGMSETHNGVRTLPAALLQLDAFLRPDGEVIHSCDGACDPD